MACHVAIQTTCLTLLLYLCIFTAPAESKNVICFYTNWAQHRPGLGAFNVTNIDPHLCTHLIFAFAQLNGNQIAADEENDNLPNGTWRQFNDLKKMNPSLKTLLSIGGHSFGTEKFVEMASSPSNRAEFISNLIIHTRYWGFDGVDLAWEHPTAADKDNYTTLVQEISEGFVRESSVYKRTRLILSLSVPAGIETIQAGYDLPYLNNSVDMFNVLTYDYHGPWEGKTALNSPLRAGDGDLLSVESTINYYLANGVSSLKLYLGLALYGRSFTLRNSTDTLPNSPITGPGPAGPFTGTEGILSYYEICQLGYRKSLDAVGIVRYSYNLSGLWFTYEDPVSLQYKLNNIDANNLGGAMIWTLDYDDFTGSFCKTGKFPLTFYVSSRLLGTTSTTVMTTATSATNDTLNTTEAITTLFTTTTTLTTTATSVATETATTAAAAITNLATTEQATATTAATETTATSSTASTTSNNFSTTSTPITTTAFTTTADLSTDTTTPTAATVSATTTARQPFKCSARSGIYPDPASCYHYYFCSLLPAYHVKCGKGTVFNPNLKKCQSTINTAFACGLPETTTSLSSATTAISPTTTSAVNMQTATSATQEITTSATITPAITTSNITTTITTPTITSPYPCEQEYGLFASRSSCYEYFYCSVGMATRLNCSTKHIFNPSTGSCEDMTTSTYKCPL